MRDWDTAGMSVDFQAHDMARLGTLLDKKCRGKQTRQSTTVLVTAEDEGLLPFTQLSWGPGG